MALKIKNDQLLYPLSGSFSGSFVGDGSQLTGIVSSKWSGSNPITRDGNVEITGSLKVTGGITGSLFGTSSFATTASFVDTTSTNAFIQGGNSFGTQALLGTNDNQNLAFETSGSVRMFISSSGFVGIGTTTPTSDLTIVRASTGTGIHVINGNTSGILVSRYSGAAGAGFTTQKFGGTFATPIAVTNSENLGRYQANAWDGTDSQVAGYLHFISAPVSAGTISSSSLPAEAAILLNAGGSANNIVERIRFTYDGNVGIGTTTPNYRLQISGSGVSGSFNANNVLYVSGSNVGIGKTNPAHALDVQGSLRTNGNGLNTYYFLNSDADNREAQILLGNTAGRASIGLRANSNNLFIKSSNGGTPDSIVVDYNNGNVGIGNISPTALLHISGSSSNALFEIDSPTLNNILFVSGSGRVGIGTGAPLYSLDVNGTIRSQGQLIVVGQIQNPTIGVVDVNGVLYSGAGVSIGVNSTNTARLLVRGSGSASTSTALRVENSNATSSLVVLDNGFVGIGTNSPARILHISARAGQTGAIRVDSNNGSVANVLEVLTNGDWAFNTNSQEVMRLWNANGGRVGIGIASPLATLHNSGSSILSGPVAINSTNVSSGFSLLVNGTAQVGALSSLDDISLAANKALKSVGSITVDIDSDNTETDRFFRVTNNNQTNTLLHVLENGNIGIGTTTPSFRLDVSGSGRFIDGLTVTSSLIAPSITGSLFGTASFALTSSFPWTITGSNIAYLNGNVGIGNSNPSQPLDISGNLMIRYGGGIMGHRTSANSNPRTLIRYEDATGGGGNTTALSFFLGNDAERFRFINFSSTELFSILGSNGNVGIGISSPTARLQVRGSGSASTSTALRVENSGSRLLLQTEDGGTTRIGGPTARLYVNVESGGTTSRFVVAGDSHFSAAGSGNGGAFYIDQGGTSGASRTIWYDESGAIKNLIQGNGSSYITAGNVGIGTVSPSALLHISGSSSNALFEIDSPTLNNILFVSGSGTVGIGTNITSASLHIKGTANTSSLVLYTETNDSSGSFRVYNSNTATLTGISNPSLTIEDYNESFGVGALKSGSFINNRLTRNVALGPFAMAYANNMRGSIAIGVNALAFANTISGTITGSIAIGDGALGQPLGGNYNIAIGSNSMLGTSPTESNSGERNLAIGAFSLRRNTSGSNNTALGYEAINGNTTGSLNTGIGSRVLRDNTTGDSNSALGWNTGRGITTGRANTILGANVTGLASNLSNTIILADGDGNQRFTINSSSIATLSGSLTATLGFTGSLFGTASFANTASYVNPLRQEIIVSGAIDLSPSEDPNLAGDNLKDTYLFVSSSNTDLGYDLYVRQNGNLVKWKWIEGSLESGLLFGGVVTYSGSLVYVTSGSGIIVDHNAVTGSEISPMVSYVTWNAITQSITNIASQQVTYLYIDDTGALQQQSTRFTNQQYHNYIPLGAVAHFDYNQISAFGGQVQTSYDQISQLTGFVDAFGPLKLSGYGLVGQSGSLRVSVSSGTSFIHGGFYADDPQFPSQFTTPAVATASFAYVHRSGSGVYFDTNGGNLYTSLRPQWYDNGTGITGSVSNNNWTIQRVYSDPKTGILYIYYGQTIYANFLTALADLSVDPFTEGDTFDFTTFVGFLVLKSNTSDITNIDDNRIVSAGLFRGSGQGSGGGAVVSNLDDLTDVSITGPANGQALIYDSGIWQNGVPSNATSASFASFATTSSFPWNISGSTISYLNGNVGIGTQSPTALLHISGANTANSASFLVQNSAGQTLISALNNRTVNINATNAVNGDTNIGTTNGIIYFNAGYNNQFRGNSLSFYSGGDASTIQGFTSAAPGIAIGYAWTVTNPNTGSALSIRGTAATSGSGVLFVTGSSNTTLLRLSSEVSSSILVVSGSGRVGIGTGTPSRALEVFRSGLVDGSIEGIRISTSHNSSNAQAALEFFHPISNRLSRIATDVGGGGLVPSMYFIHNGITAMKIANTGNIQIGTTTDSGARLHVRGSGATLSTTALRIENSNTSSSLVVLDDGNVGIGTATPTASLQINTSGASTISTIIRGATSQTANLMQWQDSSANILANVNIDGVGFFGANKSTSTLYYGLQVGQGGALTISNSTGTTNGSAVGALNSTTILAGSNAFLNARGVNLILQTNNTNTSNIARAGYFSGRTASGGAGNTIVGVLGGFNLEGTGNVANAIGVEAEMFSQVNSKTITNAFGLRINDIVNTAGTITNTYGIYIGDITSGTQTNTPFSLFASDVNAPNYFAGNVGIRTTAPSASLHVAGTTRLSSSFNTAISGSTLTVIGSGSAQPIFTVQGSQGELFSITDSLSGSLFSVNDISGLPIMEVFSDNTILMGDYQDPMLLTTKKITQTNSGSFVVYSIPTASYDGAFIDFTIKSGSNARAGTIMSTWVGSSIEFTEVDTMDIGNTSAVGLTMILSGSNAVMTGSSSTGAWTIRTIIRTI